MLLQYCLWHLVSISHRFFLWCRDFGDKDMRASGNGDQDLRQPPQAAPGPSLLGIAPGIPGGLGRGPSSTAFMKDHDLRRSGPKLQVRLSYLPSFNCFFGTCGFIDLLMFSSGIPLC